MNIFKKIFGNQSRETEDCYKGEFKHHVRKLSAETIKDAVSPSLMLLGNSASITVLVNSDQHWENLPKDITKMNGNGVLAFLLSFQMSNVKNESGMGGYATLVFHDGEKEHCVSFNKLEGSPSRVYYSDPYGGKSYLSSGNNLMKIQAQHEGEGNYSISCFEFERIIAILVCCRFSPSKLFDEIKKNRDQIEKNSDQEVTIMENLSLAEKNVTPPTILQLFESAFMEVKLDDDGDVRVTTGSGPTIIIQVEQDKKMLKYMSLFRFQKTANTSDKLAFVNTLNSKVILSRFSMPREDFLLSEYYLPYEKGIPSYQVINGFRWFERTTIGAIRQFNTANLVE